LARDKRIWLVNLFFGTGPAPTGALAEGAALGLQLGGYDVEVITGRAAYNTAATANGHRFCGVIHRLDLGPANASGFFGRLSSWVAFYLQTIWFVFTRRLPPRVLVMTTPPFLHGVFVVRNLLASRPAELILWNQDTYPEVLAAVGLLREGSAAYRVLSALERWMTARVSKAIVLDGAMARILQAHGSRRTTIIPNWAVAAADGEGEPADDLARQIAAARRKYRFLILYTGNYGWGHDLGALLDYLKNHPGQRDFFFLFVGGGEKWADLVKFREAHGLDCMAVHPYVANARYPALVRAADFGLVALERGCVGLMSPSKIHGYLTLGKPLIFLGPTGSNVAEAIEQFGCGVRADEGDTHGLTILLDDIAAGRFDYAAASCNAARAGTARYSEPVALREILGFIEEPAVDGRHK
jgi:colanic acid biosynthesis glycosyl transferase WcaI